MQTGPQSLPLLARTQPVKCSSPSVAPGNACDIPRRAQPNTLGPGLDALQRPQQGCNLPRSIALLSACQVMPRILRIMRRSWAPAQMVLQSWAFWQGCTSQCSLAFSWGAESWLRLFNRRELGTKGNGVTVPETCGKCLAV